jgi:hypothetical protein
MPIQKAMQAKIHLILPEPERIKQENKNVQKK